ncbi:MAG TPA: 2Fe-2S iron-sulfur cluster binding domain-containing protein [Pseudonocardia sp.]|nr:2Fe-2S iron-sulfur cluster binding domain-containing protein [Pseudonocardia sp.]
MAFFKRERDATVVTVQPVGKSFPVTRKDSILNEALAAGIPFPHSCTVGTCGSCKARLVSGKVRELIESAITLSAEELRANYVLACQSIAKTSVELEVPGLADMPDHPLIEVDGKVVSQTPLTHDIVALEVATAEPLDYTAGQYAELILPHLSGPRAYSFAHSPTRGSGDLLRFFIRRTPDGEFTEWLFEQDRTGTELRVRGPFGNLWLRPAEAPVLCVAGGSGLAPVKALLEAAHDAGSMRESVLVFGARSSRDLYCMAELEALAQQWGQVLHVLPVLSEEPSDGEWQGARGLVTDAIAKLDAEFLTRCDAYVCGPPPMVDAVEEQMRSMRTDAAFFHADRFLDKAYCGS